eukprot:scaffold217973_cov15-Tisochrysis_lutea.AAC.1
MPGQLSERVILLSKPAHMDLSNLKKEAEQPRQGLRTWNENRTDWSSQGMHKCMYKVRYNG